MMSLIPVSFVFVFVCFFLACGRTVGGVVGLVGAVNAVGGLLEDDRDYRYGGSGGGGMAAGAAIGLERDGSSNRERQREHDSEYERDYWDQEFSRGGVGVGGRGFSRERDWGERDRQRDLEWERERAREWERERERDWDREFDWNQGKTLTIFYFSFPISLNFSSSLCDYASPHFFCIFFSNLSSFPSKILFLLLGNDYR